MANPKPAITFRVDLKNPNSATLLPYRNNLVGNETMTEAEAQLMARSSWLPSLQNGTMEGEMTGVGANIDKKHDDTFVAYGMNAVYLKKNFAKGDSDDLLKVVSISWS